MMEINEFVTTISQFNKCYSSREDDKDRRISRLKLQPPAIIIAKAAKKEQEKIFKEALNGVTKQERERLKETVNKIAWNIKNCL